jgi:acylphosphatase
MRSGALYHDGRPASEGRIALRVQDRTIGQNAAVNTTRHLRIAGRVQGVGFRDALRAEALAQGLAGWVRNRADGSVEAVLQGEPAAVDAVAAWARRGPWAARVDRVDDRAATGDLARPYPSFERLPTA